MKILIITETIHAGGAETFVLRLAKMLQTVGEEVAVLCLNPDLENQALIRQYGELIIHRVNLPALRWLKRVDRLLKIFCIDYSIQYSLTRKVVARKYLSSFDVFHTHLFPVDQLFAKLKERFPIKVISTLHGDYNEYEQAWQNKALKRALNWPQKVCLVQAQVDQWVYISKNQWSLFHDQLGIPAAKLAKIYNGYEPPVAITVPERGPMQANGLTFIMVARGIREKGWVFLVDAFLQLDTSHKLLLVGEGPCIDELRQEHHSNERIIFAGFHPNPVALIATADVFVFPSIYKAESLPTVLIESLYCQVPVIATKVGEIEELLTDPDTGALAGQLIRMEDEQAIVKELVIAMNNYIDNLSLRALHRQNAAGAFKKFDMGACARSYLRLYQALKAPAIGTYE